MKKKGFAIIFTLLMLSFFMAVALTLFFVTRNNNRRSFFQIRDLAVNAENLNLTTIRNYEDQLAQEFVDIGAVYEGDRTQNQADVYIIPERTETYTTGSGGNILPKNNRYFTGIILGNTLQYFTCFWNANNDAITPPPPLVNIAKTRFLLANLAAKRVARQPWISSETVTGNRVTGRVWENQSNEHATNLWTLEGNDTDPISIGGYRLVSMNIDGTWIPWNRDAFDNELAQSGIRTVDLRYEKIISFTNVDVPATIDNNNPAQVVNVTDRYRMRVDVNLNFDNGSGDQTLKKTNFTVTRLASINSTVPIQIP